MVRMAELWPYILNFEFGARFYVGNTGARFYVGSYKKIKGSTEKKMAKV